MSSHGGHTEECAPVKRAKDGAQETLACHLNEEEGKTEGSSAYAEEYIANDNDDRDDNKAENEVPVEIVKLIEMVS